MSAATRRPAAGPSCCQAIAGTMIGHFVTRLEVEARKAGGALSPEQIREAAAHFLEAEQPRFAAVYTRAYDDCTKAREAMAWESARRRPFDRILMKRFAHLFPAHGDHRAPGVLSRRLIPGFNLAVDKMIGPTLYEQCQRKCQAVLDRHRQSGGGHDWEGVYADPDAGALANDVLVVVAHYFEDFEKRRTWFMALVNSHLAPARTGAADEHWLMGESAFAELMHALFADLKALMLTAPQQLRGRYGDHTFEALGAFFRRL